MVETIQALAVVAVVAQLPEETMAAIPMLVLVAKDLHRQSMELREFMAAAVVAEHTQVMLEALSMLAVAD
jgi:hypothetical protein